MYLDSKGLVALWREGLLAKAVLENKTQGYKNHPQLLRFRAHDAPYLAIVSFLHGVLEESRARGYHFDACKLPQASSVDPIVEAQGQLDFEWGHLLRKLEVRCPSQHALNCVISPVPHPLFTLVPGAVRSWEKRL